MGFLDKIKSILGRKSNQNINQENLQELAKEDLPKAEELAEEIAKETLPKAEESASQKKSASKLENTITTLLPIDYLYRDGSNKLKVLKNFGCETKPTDYSKQNGIYMGSNGCSWYYSGSAYSSYSVYLVGYTGGWNDGNPYYRYSGVRPASLLPSSQSFESLNARREDGVYKFEDGYYPKDEAQNQAELDEAFSQGNMTPTGRKYSCDFARNYSEDLNLVQLEECEYNGKRYVKSRDPNGNYSPAWIEVEPITYIIDPRDRIDGKMVALPEKIPFTGVRFDATRTDYNTSSLKIFVDLRYAVEKTESQLAPEEYVLAEGYERLERNAFKGIKGLDRVVLPSSLKQISEDCFPIDEFGYIYIDKASKKLVISKNEPSKETAEKIVPFKKVASKLGMDNSRVDIRVLRNAVACADKKFIPSKTVLTCIKEDEIDNFFINLNDKKWGELVRTVGFDKLPPENKEERLEGLFKIYYILGGFSNSATERDRAFDDVVRVLNLVKYEMRNEHHYVEEDVDQKSAEAFHQRFGMLATYDVGYTKDYAQFLRHYMIDGNDLDFMVSDLDEDDLDELEDEGYNPETFFADSYKSWSKVREKYPLHVIDSNATRFESLTIERVRDALMPPTEYEDVLEGNEELARVVGSYHYSQEIFNQMQEAFEASKKVKEKGYYISCDDSKEQGGKVTFKLLDKTDPLGFVLGNLSSCCQRYDDCAKFCVKKGYTSPNAGFVMFRSKKGKFIGQAWTWYDPVTSTLCFDNIEIQNRLLKSVESGKEDFSMEDILQAVVESAKSLAESMQKNGYDVKEVTTGEGFSDLRDLLRARFSGDLIKRSENAGPQKFPKFREKDDEFDYYSDAKYTQYVLYRKGTGDMIKRAIGLSQEINSDLKAVMQASALHI